MLEPQDRHLLTDSLRPPDGYSMDWAVATTFTLDLVALLTVPLTFALFDWEEDGVDQTGGLANLESLRRYADRITVFCQRGQISIPRPDQPLYAFLERSIFEADAPRRGGIFHPKTWLLRFTAEDEPVRYRFLCLSRNLSFDRSWDVGVVLDGELTSRRYAISANHPLGDFIAALPWLTRGRFPERTRAAIDLMEQEVRRVRWDLPSSLDEGCHFWPLGVSGHTASPFEGRADRMLVMSPFVSADGLIGLPRAEILISRVEALQELAPEALDGFTGIYVLNEQTDIDALARDEEGDGATESSEVTLQGLHGKLYVADAGWHARVWVGSANATEASLARNVEFLVELEGLKSNCGIDAVLRRGQGEPGLLDLLLPYEPKEPVEQDEVQASLDRRVEAVRGEIAASSFEAEVRESGRPEHHLLRLLRTGSKPLALEGVDAWCWPVRLADAGACRLGREPGWAGEFDVSLEAITSFFAFRVLAQEQGQESEARFVLNVPLSGAPGGRLDAILFQVLRDPQRLIQFLLFLLADGDPDESARLFLSGRDPGEGEWSSALFGEPLFEAMVRACDRDPSKLEPVNRLIQDLERTEEGKTLVPAGFHEIWNPIWGARDRRRE